MRERRQFTSGVSRNRHLEKGRERLEKGTVWCIGGKGVGMRDVESEGKETVHIRDKQKSTLRKR